MGVIDVPFFVSGLVAIPFHILSDTDLRQILEWRNDDRIRRWMDNGEIIPWTTHRDFSRRLSDADDRVYLRVDVGGDASIGVINLTDIDIRTKRAELGLYRVPETEVLGVGDKLMLVIHALSYHLGLRRLSLRVYDSNARAIKLYCRNGYAERSRHGKHLLMERDLRIGDARQDAHRS